MNTKHGAGRYRARNGVKQQKLLHFCMKIYYINKVYNIVTTR